MAPQHVPRIVAVALLGCLALFFMIASLNTAARSTFAQGSAKVSLFDRYERHSLKTENEALKAQLQALTERMEQRAFGFLLEELLARHDGVEPPRMLSAVRAVATAATSATPADRPGFAALARMLTDRPAAAGRGLRQRPRSRFGRVLPRDHPDYDRE